MDKYATTGDIVIEVVDGIQLCLSDCRIESEELKFLYPTFSSGADADKCFGPEGTASILNAALKQRFLSKVRNNFSAIKNYEDRKQLLKVAAQQTKEGIKGLVNDKGEVLTWKPTMSGRKGLNIKLKELREKLDKNEITAAEAVKIIADLTYD